MCVFVRVILLEPVGLDLLYVAHAWLRAVLSLEQGLLVLLIYLILFYY